MKAIHLTQGQVAHVDDEDHAALSSWKWFAVRARNTFYACRKRKQAEGMGRGTVWMHKEILGIPGKGMGDHRDGNGLNNQRSNLRPCTLAQNSRNVRKHADAITARTTGVSFDASRGRFEARIMSHGVRLFLGYHDTEEQAATARAAAARTYHGAFAPTARDGGGGQPQAVKA